MRDNGVRPGDLVGLIGPKCAEQIPAVLGILAAGAAYLPIGADQPAERTARILESSGVAAVLTAGARRSGRCRGADDGRRRRDAARRRHRARTEVDPTTLAYVLFTSGSTGEPKGVELTHDAVMNTVEFVDRPFPPRVRRIAAWHWRSLEADMSVLDIFAILRAGGAVVMVDEAASA